MAIAKPADASFLPPGRRAGPHEKKVKIGAIVFVAFIMVLGIILFFQLRNPKPY